MTPHYTFAMMRADSDRARQGYLRRRWDRLNLGARGGTLAVVLTALPVHFV